MDDMLKISKMQNDEWLEADGLGGFASGTVSGIRTRRYHALLLTATEPPSGRAGPLHSFCRWAETGGGNFSLLSPLYNPGVLHPGAAPKLKRFNARPRPQLTL